MTLKRALDSPMPGKYCSCIKYSFILQYSIQGFALSFPVKNISVVLCIVNLSDGLRAQIYRCKMSCSGTLVILLMLPEAAVAIIAM